MLHSNQGTPKPNATLMLLALLPLAACGPDPSTPTDAATSAAASTSAAAPRTSGTAVSSSTSPTASASSATNEPPAPPPGPRPSDAELKELTKANNTFAFALWNKVANKKGDVAFSPFSIESALTMTWLGAKGETAAQMKKTLGFESAADSAADVAGRYTKSLGGPVTIRVANRLFGEKTYSFEKVFLDATSKDFDAPLDPLDFKGAADASRIQINQWVASQTNDRIKDLLPSGEITPDMRLALVNAIYFLGDWREPFTKEATRNAPFHTTSSAQHDVPTMHETMGATFAEDDDVSVLDLPYKGDGFTMTFVLPKKVDGLDAVEKKLSPDVFDKWIGSMAPDRVSIALPKFTIDPAEPVSLGDALVSLGMKDAFDTGKADFTGIANPPNPADRLYISKVFHKAFVKVDEKGTEAAGATAVLMPRVGGMAPSKPAKEFNADHPFLFFLRDAKSHTILFAGRVADPVAK